MPDAPCAAKRRKPASCMANPWQASNGEVKRHCKTGEPCALKGASTVRRGADGNVITTVRKWTTRASRLPDHITDYLFTRHGVHWQTSGTVSARVRELGNKLGVQDLSAHRFRHSFAVALLNYGIRESALQKLMGHADLGMTLEYARIFDETVERSFTEAVSQMEEGPNSWVPNFFVQEDYTLFAEGDSVSWIQLPVGFCRRNPKLHCESDVKCFLCERFCAAPQDLPRLQQMHERFMKLGLDVAQTSRASLVADDILPPHHLIGIEIRGRAEAHPAGGKQLQPGGDPAFIRIWPTHIVSWGIEQEDYHPYSRDVDKTGTRETKAAGEK